MGTPAAEFAFHIEYHYTRDPQSVFFVNSFQCILSFFGFDVIVFSFHSFQFAVVIAVTAVTITVVEVSLFFSRRFYQVVGDIGLVTCTAIVIIGALCCCIVNTSFTFSSV